MFQIREWFQRFADERPKTAVALLGVLGVITMIAIMVLLFQFGPGSGERKETAANMGSTTTSAPPTTSPFAAHTPTTMSFEQRAYPESDTLTPEQLAETYNQASSGLDVVTYKDVTDIAKRFVRADVTGEKLPEFASFYDSIHDEPYATVKNYRDVYASARRDPDGTIAAYVWFAGTRIPQNTPIKQAQYGILVRVNDLNKVEVVDNRSLSRNDIGVQIADGSPA